MSLFNAGQLNADTVKTETLTGTRTITAAEIRQYKVWVLDPGGGSQDVNLPVASADFNGECILVENTADAAESLAIKDTATVITIAQNGSGFIYCRNGTWRGLSGASV